MRRRSSLAKGLQLLKRPNFNLSLTAFLGVVLLVVFLFFWGNIFSVDITSLEGRVISGERIGNTAVYTLDLSHLKEIGDYAFHCETRGSQIKICADEEEIYSYGAEYAQRHSDIGKVYSSISLPEHTKLLIISLTPSDSNGSTDIIKAELTKVEDIGKYYLINNTLSLPMSLIYLIFAVGSLLITMTLIKTRKTSVILSFFGLMMFCFSVRLADNGGHYLVLFENQHAWNILVYLTRYILNIAVTCYCYMILRNNLPLLQKRIFYYCTGTILVLGIIAMVLISFTEVRFCDLDYLYRCSLCAVVFLLLYSAWYVVDKRMMDKSFYSLMGMNILMIAAVFLVPYINIMNFKHDSIMIDIETMGSVVLLSIFGIMLCSYFQNEIEEKWNREVQMVELQNELKDIRYKSFTSQMQSHFLYNALASIRQIIFEDPVYAAQLLTDFTIHLKGTVRAMSDDEPILFSEELQSVKAYVDMEKARLEDRLFVKYDISVTDFYVLPLSIQPIVENAIRHGIFKKGAEGGWVIISTEDTPQGWVISVRDNGVGFDAEQINREIRLPEKNKYSGLRNMIFRLENIMHAQVDIQSVIGQGSLVTVTIPKVQEVDHESDRG